MYLLRKNKSTVITLFCFTYLVLCSFFVFADDNTTQQPNLTQETNFSDLNLDELNLSSNTIDDTNITVSNSTTQNDTINNQNETNQTQANNTALQNTTNINQNKNNASLQNDLKIADQLKTDSAVTFVSVTPENFDVLINSDRSPYDFIYHQGKLLLRSNALGEVMFYYLDFLGNTRGNFDVLINSDRSPYDFIYHQGKLLLRSNALGEVMFYYLDFLGNSRAAFDENKTILSSKDYMLFGEQINNFGQTSGKAYSLKDQDKSDLYFFGARYYSALTGRFISADPIYDGVESSYVYAKDNPLKFFDPDGKKAQLIGAGLSDNARLQQLYFRIGSVIPRVNSIISDTYDHVIANKDANVEYYTTYLRKENEAKLQGKEIDGVTVNGDLSLIDVNKIESYGYGKDNIILHQLFHESIHQADVVASQEKGITYGKKSTPDIELNIENEIFNSLGLKKSYDDQIKDKDSWVVKNQILKKDYKNIVRISNHYIEHYQALIEKEIRGEN